MNTGRRLTTEQYLDELISRAPRPDPELEKRAAELKRLAETGGPGFTEDVRKGHLAVYRCGSCRTDMYTENYNGGDTPLVTKCKTPRCSGFAVKMEGAELPEDVRPQWEWYVASRKDARRARRAFPTLFSHIKRGGLVLRRKGAR